MRNPAPDRAPLAVAPFLSLALEADRIALARALRIIPPDLLGDRRLREIAYARAGLLCPLDSPEDSDAVDRARLFHLHAAPPATGVPSSSPSRVAA